MRLVGEVEFQRLGDGARAPWSISAAMMRADILAVGDVLAVAARRRACR